MSSVDQVKSESKQHSTADFINGLVFGSILGAAAYYFFVTDEGKKIKDNFIKETQKTLKDGQKTVKKTQKQIKKTTKKRMSLLSSTRLNRRKTR